jgi:iron complex outermembrane receptor protein
MKKVVLFSIYMVFIFSFFGQKTKIQGVITNQFNKPIPNVLVSLNDLNLKTKTNESGFYQLENLSLGKVVIEIIHPDYAKQIKEVTLIDADTVILNVELSDRKRLFSEVTVIGNKVNMYAIDSNSTLSKLPLKNLENPQIYNSIPQKLLQDQVATEMSDALKNATGVARLWESTGRGGDGAEFYTMRGFSVQPTLINGVPGINNGVVDPNNIESVEVLKGPSGTLFGSPLISYGGLINITTKKPFEKLAGSFGYVLGRFGQNRITSDINIPIDNKTAVRISSAYNDQNTFQDAGFRKSFSFAPSLKFKPTEKLTFLVNMEFQNAESANAPMIFLNRYAPLTHTSLDEFENIYEKSYTSNDLNIKNPTVNVQAQALLKLNKHWNSQTILSRSQSKNNGYYHYFWDFSDGNTFGRYISKRNGETQTVDIQQNFQGDFNLGKLRNRMVIGFDFYNSTIVNASSAWVQNGSLTLLDGQDSGFLTQNGVDSLLSTTFEGVSQVKNNVLSAYISDVINFTPTLSAMASVRLDRFSGATNYWSTDNIESQVAVSPKFGLVYQPIKDKFSLFANYMNGFINQAPVQVADTNGANVRMKSLNPEQANQMEFGIKTNLLKDKLSFTASYYNILVSNKVMSDPNNFNDVIQGGKVESKGVEFSLITNPYKGLDVVAGLSINQSKVVEDDPANGYLGLRPEEAGPSQLANFWVQYSLPTTKLKGLGLGFGGNYASEHLTLNRSVTGTFTLPSYTILNAALSYRTTHFDLILKADNLLNKKYYSGWSTITPQQLRSLSLSFNYKF